MIATTDALAVPILANLYPIRVIQQFREVPKMLARELTEVQHSGLGLVQLH